MPRKTQDQLLAERRFRSVVAAIEKNKFFNDSKYWKNNYWSWAAWDSWAAQGKAGGCSTCRENYYIATLANTRANNKFCKQVSGHFCNACVDEIEKVIKRKFKRH